MLLLFGLPGLSVWAIGQLLVFARLLGDRSKSPLGLRLTMAGLGLFLLGMFGAIVLAVFAAGLWPLGLAVAALFGWLPVLFFWWATRDRVTGDTPS
jgi:hypothetical protein